MTRIGNSNAPQGPAAEARSSKLEGHDKTQSGRNEKSDRRKPVDKAEERDAKARGGVFEQKVAQAISKSKLVMPHPEGEGEKTLLVVLHPAGHPAGHMTAAPQMIPPAASQAAPSGPVSIHRVEWVEGLTNRIEHALQTGRKAGGDSISLSLDLGVHELGGVRGVEIIMSPSTLDVVLTRTEGQATVEYLAATHALAERLQDRFSRRIVRIHEVAVQLKKSSAQGLEEISQILGKPEPMR